MTATERSRRCRAKARAAAPVPVRVKAVPDAALKARRRHERKRWKQSPGGKRLKARAVKRRIDSRPFVGVDGEGCGLDDKQRQNYMLLRAGDRELYTGQPLTTRECLEFLLDMPAIDEAILVGFSFGYDVTMILRDLPGVRDPAYPDEPSPRERLFRPRVIGQSAIVWWQGIGIDYLPRNHLRLCYGTWDPQSRRMVPIPGTSRTVYETIGFFQCSFLKAIEDFGVGREHQATIERMKAQRGAFSAMTDEVRAYCALECRFLADLMEVFRDVCLSSDPPLRPRTWNGAGKLASALHKIHGTMTRAVVLEKVPAAVMALAGAAYYGGRFEVTRIGDIAGPIWEYDIRSAYPAAMERLPCLEHGTWEQVGARALRAAEADPDSVYVAAVSFRHDEAARLIGDEEQPGRRDLCGLPFRQTDGRLCWPTGGNGVYWGVEIRAASRHGCRVSYKGGWLYNTTCECQPFGWVRSVYDYRCSLAEEQGKAYKAAINSLYGKLAQRIGTPRYANLVWAGLVTAATRAALLDAAAADPSAVVMLATDGILSLRPLPVAIGEGLGQWEAKRFDRAFIVQPGLYWTTPGKRAKSRGVSVSIFAKHVGLFESAWSEYAKRSFLKGGGRAVSAPPVVRLPVTLFVGLKMAQARGKPDTAGQWTGERAGDEPRQFSFAWGGKRGGDAVWCGSHVRTYPLEGGPAWVSKPHGSDPALVEEMDRMRADLEEQPDYVDAEAP